MGKIQDPVGSNQCRVGVVGTSGKVDEVMCQDLSARGRAEPNKDSCERSIQAEEKHAKMHQVSRDNHIFQELVDGTDSNWWGQVVGGLCILSIKRLCQRYEQGPEHTRLASHIKEFGLHPKEEGGEKRRGGGWQEGGKEKAINNVQAGDDMIQSGHELLC